MSYMRNPQREVTIEAGVEGEQREGVEKGQDPLEGGDLVENAPRNESPFVNYEQIEENVIVENDEDSRHEKEVLAETAGVPPLDQCQLKKLCPS